MTDNLHPIIAAALAAAQPAERRTGERRGTLYGAQSIGRRISGERRRAAQHYGDQVRIAQLEADNARLRELLADVRNFWAGGDCPPELWARISATLKAGP